MTTAAIVILPVRKPIRPVRIRARHAAALASLAATTAIYERFNDKESIKWKLR